MGNTTGQTQQDHIIPGMMVESHAIVPKGLREQ